MQHAPGATLINAVGVTCRVRGQVLLPPTDLTVSVGEIVALIGPSGSGKTTMLSCCAGLRRPDAGSLVVCGSDLTAASPREASRLRLRSIGVVYQHADLLPELSPVENIMLPVLLAGGDATVARSAAERLLDEMSVETAATTSQLSGGEAQRVAVARALVSEPPLLLADEPTGSLDPATRDLVLHRLTSAVRRREMGALFVTHDPVVAGLADRIVSIRLTDRVAS